MDLPPDLELPLRSGAPWWYWLGNRPALDFANTLRERWWRRVETLVHDDDLVAWLVAAELLIPGPDVEVPVGTLQRARRLREAINACAVTVLDGGTPDAADVELIDHHARAGHAPTRLRRGHDGLPVLASEPTTGPVDYALGRIALDAAFMLGDPAQRGRVRVCAATNCSARFYDRSPAGARRWCSMAGCGNVAKARRHRARAGTGA
jgi:predicted RNA-binding Zn ribbon-like protein